MTHEKPHGGRPRLDPEHESCLLGYALTSADDERLRAQPGITSDYVRAAIEEMMWDTEFRPRSTPARPVKSGVVVPVNVRDQLDAYGLHHDRRSRSLLIANAVVRALGNTLEPDAGRVAQTSYVVQRLVIGDGGLPRADDLAHRYTVELAREYADEQAEKHPAWRLRVMRQRRIGDRVWIDHPPTPFEVL